MISHNCKNCSTPLECMAGRSAHASNWYCPKCDKAEHSETMGQESKERSAMSEVTITDDQFHQLLLLQGIDYHPNSFEFAFMKQGYELSRRAAVSGDGQKLEAIRHAANEWADMATSAVQWIKNIKAGISSEQEALLNLEDIYQHCRKTNDKAMSAKATLSSPSQPSAHKYEYCAGSQTSVSHYRGEMPNCNECSQPSAADKPVAASEIELLQSELAATKEELAKERVNQTSFNECSADLAEARAQLAAIKGKAPEPLKAD